MITATTEREQFAGDGSTTGFSWPYMLLEEADLVVLLETSAGVESVQAINSQYTITGVGTGSVTVTMVTAPASGQTLTIYRSTDRDQETDYTANGDFPAETHEAALDKLTLMVQELQRQIDLAIKYPDGEPPSGLVDKISTKPNRTNKYLGFDASGNLILSSVDLAALELVAPTTVDTADLVNDSVTAGKTMIDNHFYCGVSSGTNTLSVTSGKSVSSYTNKGGMIVSFRAAAANTGNVTLNLDGLGAVPVRWRLNQLKPASLNVGYLVVVVFDWQNYMWQLLTPPLIQSTEESVFIDDDDGSANSILINTSGSNAYDTDRLFMVNIAATNTHSAVKFNYGDGEKDLTRPGGVPLLPGDVVTGEQALIYTKSATEHQLLNPANPLYKGTPGFRNLVCKRNTATPTTQLDVDADSVDLIGRTGDFANVLWSLHSVNFTIDATGTGQNGLDTGSLAADTWYYIWLALDNSDGTSYAILSTASAAGSVTWADSSNDIFVRMVGVVRTNGSAQFETFHQQGNEVAIGALEIFSNQNNTSYTSIQSVTSTNDIEDVLPPIAIKARGTYGKVSNNTSFLGALASTSAGLGEIVFVHNDANNGAYGGFDYYASPFEIQLVESQDFYYKATTSHNPRLEICGYTLSL